MIEVVDLRKSFHHRLIFDSLSLRVARGEAVGILGQNGSGKTTLLRVLAGLAGFQAGEIRLCGWDLGRDARAARACTGFFSHQPQIYPELSAAENLMFYSRMYALDLSKLQLEAALERAGLLEWCGERAALFSRGMLQRLGLARACLNEPDVLLLDEPASGLDREGRRILNDMIRTACARGSAVVVTAHSEAQMDAPIVRTFELNFGKLTLMNDVHGMERASDG
ncbi:MAG: heme ABC exporter ATP-binding protein CcmA [Anaerolineales bacterium]|nr:heme ABC exporter ATP-binding protein CcmA [Anaerolineales bacterium]